MDILLLASSPSPSDREFLFKSEFKRKVVVIKLNKELGAKEGPIDALFKSKSECVVTLLLKLNQVRASKKTLLSASKPQTILPWRQS